MFECVGLGVSRLIRIRYGPVCLPRSVARGRWDELHPRVVETWCGELGLARANAAKKGPTPAQPQGRPTGGQRPPSKPHGKRKGPRPAYAGTPGNGAAGGPNGADSRKNGDATRKNGDTPRGRIDPLKTALGGFSQPNAGRPRNQGPRKRRLG